MRLSYSERKDLINILTVPQLVALKYHWPFWARDKQIIPEELLDSKSKKFIWIIKSGRGFGKTRTGAETIRMLVDNYGYRRVSIVGADASVVRDIMIEGESGILSVYPFWNKPVYEPSKRRITFKSGAIATIFYGSEPDKSRGAQSDLIWCDEFIKWRYTEETLDNLLLGLRIGKKPICIITTTPRPIRILKELINDDRVIVTEGSTYENKDNLSDVFYSTNYKTL
jgi:phage terminase large subunit-like protein